MHSNIDSKISDKSAVRNSTTAMTLLCLCITAASLSAPLNGLSPSLSMVAKEFGFDEKERDIYLGSHLALSTMVGQMIGSFLSGILADAYSRKNSLVVILLTGAITTFSFGIPWDSFYVLLVLRISMGACQGSMVPILFSLLGDYYTTERRPAISAVVSSCLGGGMMMGQLFAGFSLNMLGWRGPFLIIGIVTLISAICVHKNLFDPIKGGNEEELTLVLQRGVSLPSMSLITFLRNLMLPTVVLMLFQTVPNTVPWGVLSAHLHDFMATDAHLSMQQATSLLAIFGAGAALGGIFGGFIGAGIYAFNRRYLPLFMGLTLGAAAVLMKEVLMLDLTQPGALQFAFPVLVLAGSLAAVNGANIRVVILNLTSPESRGASIALLNFVNCIGRGFGPTIIEKWMSAYSISRRDAISTILNFWLLSGSLLCCAGMTIAQDEDKLKIQLQKFALESEVKKMSGSSVIL